MSYFSSAALRLLCGVTLLLPTLSAQDATGRIVGGIQDPQGAVIAGAKVTVTNVATNLVNTVSTGQDGSFQILLLPIGSYTLTVEAPGFRKLVTPAFKIEINQSQRFDLKLELGQTTETIQVEATPSGVETVNATIGQSVTEHPIRNLPLNGRNVLSLALLQPGVTDARPLSGSAGSFNVAGNRSDSVTFLVDGGMNNNLLSNGVVFNPNPDTIAEFRVLTSNFTAEFGRNGGGIVSVVTKSGTNRLHGSAFDFVRNEAFNANRFFNNAQGLPKELFKRHQFGATVGGPVTIPKIVNGKDKLFFFFGWQSQRQRRLQSNPEVVTFTPAELRGDFSQSGPGRTPDAGVAAFLRANPYFQSNPAMAAQAIIDPARFSTPARNYIAAGMIPVSATGSVVPQGAGKVDLDEYTGKVDWNASQRDRFSVTLGWQDNTTLTPFSFASDAGLFPRVSLLPNRFGSIAYTRTFSPNVVNDFRFTAQRGSTDQNNPAVQRPGPAELGIAVNPDRVSGPPILAFNGLTVGFNNNGPAQLINNTFIYQDTLSWTRGRHTFRMGGFLAAFQNNTQYDFFVNGIFFFSGPATNGGIASGNDRADFLFGLPDFYRQFPSAPSNIRSKNVSGFFQDEWRVTRNLVLTLGVRYEYSQPKFDLQGRSFSTVFGQQSQVFTRAPRGLVFPGDPSAPRGANFADKNDWAPRFGFAYSPSGKMSVRGGFGVFHDILKGEDNLQFNGQAPFFAVSNLGLGAPRSITGEPLNFRSPFLAAGLPNPFPSRPTPRDIDFNEAGFLPVGDGGVYFVNPNLRTPYAMHYNLSVQRELWSKLVAEVSFVGSQGRKLTALQDANPFVPGTTRRLYNSQSGVANDTFSYLDTFQNAVTSNYNSMQASLTRRMADSPLGSAFFTLAYTWGKSIDNASGFRERNSAVPAYEPGRFRAVSDFDVTHRVAFSGGWNLPFDRMWKSGPKNLVSGWSLFPIVSWRTGFPLDVGAFSAASRTQTRPGPSGSGDVHLVRANLVAPIEFFDVPQQRTINGRTGWYYFNPNSFSTAGLSANSTAAALNPALANWGTLGRNAFRDPNRFNFDMTVSKTLAFGEHMRLELRGEAFNLFNSLQLTPSGNTTNINNRLFGQISSSFDPRILQIAARFSF